MLIMFFLIKMLIAEDGKDFPKNVENRKKEEMIGIYFMC
jgi:hypothetical protein